MGMYIYEAHIRRIYATFVIAEFQRMKLQFNKNRTYNVISGKMKNAKGRKKEC